MATPKKTSAKKPVSTKAAPKKTVPVAHKPAAKKAVLHATAKKPAKTATKSHRYISLALVPDDKPFLTFRVTRQTLYWLIFSVAILGLGLWVLNLNMQVLSLYDQIDNNNVQTSLIEPIPHPVTKK